MSQKQTLLELLLAVWSILMPHTLIALLQVTNEANGTNMRCMNKVKR